MIASFDIVLCWSASEEQFLFLYVPQMMLDWTEMMLGQY